MASTTTSLNSLLERAGSGDETAFRRLYDEVSPIVLGFLIRMLGDRFVAEDVLQDAMVQTWRNASDFDETRASATTWITAIARNKALDQLRKTGRYNRMIKEDDKNIAAVFGHDTAEATTPESSLTGDRLAGCFQELTRDTAACIQLAYLDGFTFSEIARKLGRPLGTVKSWVRRGLVSLEECMRR